VGVRVAGTLGGRGESRVEMTEIGNAAAGETTVPKPRVAKVRDGNVSSV
jgi:hypothetical protein